MASPDTNSALLIIDVQNDFCPGGSIAVEDGDSVIPVINRISPLFPLVICTKDWHPSGHVSFASSHDRKQPFESEVTDGVVQVYWPDHCIQGTPGAALHDRLDLSPVHYILHKGFRPDLDSYSAFFENDRKTATGLASLLKGMGIESVYCAGLAEDVCVFYTAMDALRLGFSVKVIGDGVRGVDTPAGNCERTRREMRSAGIHYTDSAAL